MITCPSCNHQNEVGSSFCENCGHDMRELASQAPDVAIPPAGTGLSCSSCGYSNISGAAFCENCGNPLSQESPSIPSPAPPPAAPEQENGELICGNCGHPNVPGSRFCENCGSELKSALPVSPPQVAPQPPLEQQPEPSPQPSPSLDENVCSQCGFTNPPGTIFCGDCGLQLSEEAQEPQVSEPAVVEPSKIPTPQVAPIPVPSGFAGSFEVKNSGASISIPAGKKEWIIGREDPVSGIFPEIDLDPHGGHDGGVGRKHVRLFVQNEQLLVEDQDSVNGTFINKQKLTAFQPHPLKDGDELRLGKIILVYQAN